MPESEARDAALRKTFLMERNVSYLRAIVISFNIAVYFLLIGADSPRAPLAFTIIGVAGAYGLWSLLARPYERYPLLRFGFATLACDAILITLWVLATGGPDSEFWLLYFVSIVSVAMRYDLGQTLWAALGEALLYEGAMLADGGMGGVAAAVRPGYILVVGLAAGFLARQERMTREEGLWFERLADEHARMLAREREVSEQLRQLDSMKTEFVANAAHELRTPLTTLAGLATTLAMRWTELSTEQLGYCLSSMQRQGGRTKVLIDNLLDLSSLERGRLMIALAPVSLASAVRDALDAAPPPDGKSVEVAVDDVRALADATRLEQVLTNLLVNAYRYGGSRITLRCASDEATVVLTVTDDGEGISADVTAHLFEPFGRGDNVGGVPGSGLGLAISRRLVEAFGGELWYEPASPHGAAFSVRLRAAS